jgi:curved DNA-binding protein CbpA
MNKTYYDILGVAKEASAEEIKKAYRKKAKQFHPDTNATDGEAMAELNVAYEVLSDPEKRTLYDATGSGSDPREKMEAEAREGITALIIQYIQAKEGQGDVMTAVLADIRNQLRAQEANVAEGEKVLQGLSRGLKKLKFKGKGHDYARTALEIRIEDVRHKIELSRLCVERIKLASTLVNEYEYEVSWDAERQPFFGPAFLIRHT